MGPGPRFARPGRHQRVSPRPRITDSNVKQPAFAALRRGKPSASAPVLGGAGYAVFSPRRGRGLSFALAPGGAGESTPGKNAEGMERRMAPIVAALGEARARLSERRARPAALHRGFFVPGAVASGRDKRGRRPWCPLSGGLPPAFVPAASSPFGQPVVMPADGWPGPPGCGDHVYPRPRAPHPTPLTMTSHENALVYGWIKWN